MSAGSLCHSVQALEPTCRLLRQTLYFLAVAPPREKLTQRRHFTVVNHCKASMGAYACAVSCPKPCRTEVMRWCEIKHLMPWFLRLASHMTSCAVCWFPLSVWRNFHFSRPIQPQFLILSGVKVSEVSGFKNLISCNVVSFWACTNRTLGGRMENKCCTQRGFMHLSNQADHLSESYTVGIPACIYVFRAKYIELLRWQAAQGKFERITSFLS